MVIFTSWLIVWISEEEWCAIGFSIWMQLKGKNNHVSCKKWQECVNKLLSCLNVDFTFISWNYQFVIMKWNYKQWWSTILSKSTKQTITSHPKSLNAKEIMTLSIEIQVLDWDRHKNVVGLKQIMGFVFKIGENICICHMHTLFSVTLHVTFCLYCTVISR